MIERAYAYRLASMQGLSATRKFALRSLFPSARQLLEAKPSDFPPSAHLTAEEVQALISVRNKESPGEAYGRFMTGGFHFVIRGETDYPKRLETLKHPPFALFYKGRLPSEEGLSIGIVGARACTPYGLSVAHEFAKELAFHGFEIISGMAKGIDGGAARGALKGGGRSYAVLGCGVDICYPQSHRGLYRDLTEQGGILSEYPLGTAPMGHHFPLRNRLISGLSDVLLVMEARERSGSLITADYALEQGKEVFALPGPIHSDLSTGCHHLIRQGAGILISVEELLADLRFVKQEQYKKFVKDRVKLGGLE